MKTKNAHCIRVILAVILLSLLPIKHINAQITRAELVADFADSNSLVSATPTIDRRLSQINNESDVIEDTFSSETLADYWTWVDPDQDGSYSLTTRPGHLRLTTPCHDSISTGSGHPDRNTDAGRVVMTISGDFSIETEVDLVNTGNAWQLAGILLFVDSDNYLRFQRGYSYGNLLAASWAEGGVPNGNALEGFNPEPTWLRVNKNSSQVSLYYSVNGSEWELYEEIDVAYPHEMNVGLFAAYGNNCLAGPTFSADFNYALINGEVDAGEGIVSGATFEPNPITGIWFCSDVVVSAGQGMTTVADSQGNYSLTLPAGLHTLSYSKSGYQTWTYEDVQITRDEILEWDKLMFQTECWGTDQVCLNELINVIPRLGTASEIGGALDTLCNANRRIEENGDELGGLTLILIGIVDIVGVLADEAEMIIDLFDGLVTCVEDFAYDWFETLLGPEGAREFSRSLWLDVIFFPAGGPIISYNAGIIAFLETRIAADAAFTDYDSIESVELHLYAGDQHLGVADGELEYTIPKSYLFRMGDRYQIAIVKDPPENYEVQVKGNDSVAYDLTIVHPKANAPGVLTQYNEVVAVDDSIASMDLSPHTTNYTLEVDADGDGNTDDYISPDVIEEVQPYHQFLPITVRDY